MNSLRLIIPVAAALLLAGQAAAQNEDAATAKEEAAQMQATQVREEEVTRRLREAEARMAEAARQIAELTTDRLPQIHRLERRFAFIDGDRPRLGVTIGDDDQGPVEGVHVRGVTPGSAASEAGLRAGDILTSVNGEALSAENADAANSRLLDFMAGIEAGDKIDLEYLRDGKVGKVEVEPRSVEMNVFAFRGDGMPHLAPGAPGAPGMAPDMRRELIVEWTSGARRTSTSLSAPNRCTWASSKPAADRLLRIASRSAACGYPTSSRIPPVKSMPSSSGRSCVNSETIDTITTSADMTSATFRRVAPRKSIVVVCLIRRMVAFLHRHAGYLAAAEHRVDDCARSTIAVNIEVRMPIIKVIANPLIGPVPNANKTIAAIKVVMLASAIDDRAFS